MDDDFESGYSSDAPTVTPAPASKPEVKEAPAAAVKPAPAATKAAEPTLAQLWSRLDVFEASQNKLAGHIGGLTRTQKEIQTAMATAKTAAKSGMDAPTQGEIKDAKQSPAEWEALKADFPEWAVAIEKMLDHRAPPAFDQEAFKADLYQKMEGESKATQDRIVNSALNAVSPGWQQEVQSDPFKAWHAAQTDEIKGLAASDDVGDAARMLKLYEASKSAPVAQAAKAAPSAREKRLAAAVTPRGSGGGAASPSEEDDFVAGYR